MRSFLEKGYGWPLFVVLLLVSSVAMMGIVVMAARSDGGAQVIDNYYEQAVRWDSLAEARGAAAALGWQADLDFTSSEHGMEGTVGVTDSTGAAVEGLRVTVTLRRPQLATIIAEVKATDASNSGLYHFSTDASGSGLWDVEADILPSDGSEKMIRFDWRRDIR